MINNRNVVGLRISDVTTILKEEKSEVIIIAKSKVYIILLDSSM